MKFRENEDAVSPVIGVILMVAITVILAAVIAAFVFGMASNVDTQPKSVAATAQVSGGYIVVTYQGGPDHDEVTTVTCSVVDASNTEGGNLVGDAAEDIEGVTLKVGHKWSVSISEIASGAGGEALVTVSAKFSDGTERTILDTNLKVPKSTP
ncbi:type IV pilin N-terminal domain-containing protein [Methanoculleus bourgensis]|nr:type IV pilin N-terminal domain-containing protein [Methanoculleus bourgensis]